MSHRTLSTAKTRNAFSQLLPDLPASPLGGGGECMVHDAGWRCCCSSGTLADFACVSDRKQSALPHIEYINRSGCHGNLQSPLTEHRPLLSIRNPSRMASRKRKLPTASDPPNSTPLPPLSKEVAEQFQQYLASHVELCPHSDFTFLGELRVCWS